MDDDHSREEGSQREKEWTRLSLKRSIGSRSRRADTWLSERRDLDLRVYISRSWEEWWNTYGCHEGSIRATRFIRISCSSSDRILALEPREKTSKRAQIERADRFGWQPTRSNLTSFYRTLSRSTMSYKSFFKSIFQNLWTTILPTFTTSQSMSQTPFINWSVLHLRRY